MPKKPKSIYPDELVKMLLKHCPTPGLVNRAWPRLQLLLRRAYSDVYPLAPAGILDPERVRQALADGFRTKVDAVQFVSLSADEPLKDLNTDDMINHVARSLTTNHHDAFRALARHDPDGRFHDEYFLELGYPLINSFFTEHMDAFTAGDTPTHMMIMSVPTFTLFFFLGHLFAGDEAAVDAMLPLMEMLPILIPVGEEMTDLGTWIVLVK